MHNPFEPAIPAMRHDQLIVTRAGNDLVVFDERSNALHTLNTVAQTVWEECNGTHSISDIVIATSYPAEVVKQALKQLEDATLLGRPLKPSQRSTDSRRTLMKKAGLAAAIPTIVSISAPIAANAQTGGQPAFRTTRECSSANTCSEDCVGTCSGVDCLPITGYSSVKENAGTCLGFAGYTACGITCAYYAT